MYDEDGRNRRENITDWALAQFRAHYGPAPLPKHGEWSKEIGEGVITKWDIFYYVYGLLHHPGYRARYADNLKRELPRIPLVPAVLGGDEASGFWAFSEAGKKLAELHLHYEDVKGYDL